VIYVLEEITIKPGRLDEYLAAFNEEYVPNADARGMKLVGSWVTPPFELKDEGNQLVAMFAIEDGGFWSVRSHSREPEVLAWWEKAREMQVTRTRKFLDPASFSPMT